MTSLRWFYEWSKNGREKVKYLFRLPGEAGLYMAGVWNTFREKDGRGVRRFEILTTAANDSMREDLGELSPLPDDTGHTLIHDRMPVVLRWDERAAWLGDGADLEGIFDWHFGALPRTGIMNGPAAK